MSKSIYSCVIEGDPICDHAKQAHDYLTEAKSNLLNLARVLSEIENNEEEETELGYLMGQVAVCMMILNYHTKPQA